jgi:hypothetical protein
MNQRLILHSTSWKSICYIWFRSLRLRSPFVLRTLWIILLRLSFAKTGRWRMPLRLPVLLWGAAHFMEASHYLVSSWNTWQKTETCRGESNEGKPVTPINLQYSTFQADTTRQKTSLLMGSVARRLKTEDSNKTRPRTPKHNSASLTKAPHRKSGYLHPPKI